MAHWLNAADGNFNTRADWSTGRVPVFNNAHKDAAILDAKGGAYTVTATTNESVASLQTAANATLALTGAVTFVVHTGTGPGFNAGSIAVGDGATLFFNGGTIDNTGAISLAAGASNAFVNLKGAVTLRGGGAIVMGDSPFNGIVDTLGLTTATLTNVDNTITGAGVIGSGGIPGGGLLTLVNEAGGVIDATGATSALILNTPGATLTNDGLLEGSGFAGLDIASTTVDGSGGGVIHAAKYSEVRLQESVIVGGTLTSAPNGFILAFGQTTFDGAVSAVTNQGEVDVQDNSTLLARGALDNAGSIFLFNSGVGSDLVVDGNLTLTGGGVLDLGDTAVNVVQANSVSGTLTNVDNTITGDGLLGNGELILANQAGGVIRETGSHGLTIETGGAAIRNSGRIVAAGAGGIMIQSAVTNRGVIECFGANGSGANLTIDAAVNNSGTLVADGGTFTLYEAVTGSGSATIKGGTLKLGAAFNQNVTFTSQNGILELARSQSYTKTVTGIAVRGQGDFLDLDDIAFVGAGQASYVDNGSHTGGVLTVTDGTHTAHITLAGNYTASTFGTIDDGHGGTDVFYKSAPAGAPPARVPPGRFVAAMAAFGAAGGSADHGPIEARHFSPAMLASPVRAIA